MLKCSLCNETKLIEKESINKEDLINLYKDTHQIDISNQLEKVDVIKYYHCNNCDLEYFDGDTAGDGPFYEQLQQRRKTYYSPDRKEFSFAEKHISNECKVLEVGSGSGLFAQRLVKENYIGLEFNDKAIERAKTNNITLLKKSIEEFANSSSHKFDVVCSFHVLEHVVDTHDFIKASLEVLKVGGKLIIAVPCNDSIYTNNVNHVLNLPPHHVGRWNIKTMKNLEEIFKIDLVAQNISSANEVTSKKEYIGEVLTNAFIKAFYPKNTLLLKASTVKRIRRFIYKLNSILGIYKLYKDTSVIGENMTYIYVKR